MEDLAGRLRTILRDSTRINQHANDPEMVADLYYRISQSYTNTPDLRITWLLNLAHIHARNVSTSRPISGQPKSRAAHHLQ